MVQRELFAASCPDICSSPNASEDVRAACDQGSLEYCFGDLRARNTSNIATPECLATFDRLVRTRSAERTNTTYSNPIKTISHSLTDYVNALKDNSRDYILQNLNQFGDNKSTQLINILKSEVDITHSLFNEALNKCVETKNTKCSDHQWFDQYLRTFMNTIVENTKSANTPIDKLIDVWSAADSIDLILLYDNQIVPMYGYILSKLTYKDLPKSGLFKIRAASPYMKTKLDLIAINFVLGTTLTDIPKTNEGKYNIDLSAKAALYDSSIRSYYKLCLNYSASDQFALSVIAADAKNKDRCASVDPLTDPVCVAMNATGDLELANSIGATQMLYCMKSENIAKPECVSYINNAIAKDSSFDKNIAYKSALIAATNKDGSLNKEIINKFDGMVDWLLINTADAMTTDESGNKIINSSCGSDKRLSIDQCKQVCIAYPELCEKDQAAKCSLPAYRYAELFQKESLEVPNPNSESEQSVIAFYIIIAIVILFVAAVAATYIKNTKSMNAFLKSLSERFNRNKSIGANV